MDLTATALSGIPTTTPGIIGYGTNDNAVWYRRVTLRSVGVHHQQRDQSIAAAQ